MVPRNHWKPLAVSDDFADFFSKNLSTYKTRKKTSNLTLKGAPTLVHQNKNVTLKRLVKEDRFLISQKRAADQEMKEHSAGFSGHIFHWMMMI
jgi:hypothetical protein